jgi:hypothetical protein
LESTISDQVVFLKGLKEDELYRLRVLKAKMRAPSYARVVAALLDAEAGADALTSDEALGLVNALEEGMNMHSGQICEGLTEIENAISELSGDVPMARRMDEIVEQLLEIKAAIRSLTAAISEDNAGQGVCQLG